MKGKNVHCWGVPNLVLPATYELCLCSLPHSSNIFEVPTTLQTDSMVVQQDIQSCSCLPSALYLAHPWLIIFHCFAWSLKSLVKSLLSFFDGALDIGSLSDTVSRIPTWVCMGFLCAGSGCFLSEKNERKLPPSAEPTPATQRCRVQAESYPSSPLIESMQLMSQYNDQ